MLVEAGKVLGVDVLDHLILCANRVRLTKQRGMM
jgi:DNA repair protein RadC